MADKCSRCGSGNVVGYKGEWECMDCGYRFKPPAFIEKPERSRSSRGRWIAVTLLVFIIGFLLGCFIAYPIITTTIKTITVTQSIETPSPTTIEKTVTITRATEVVREKTVTITAFITPTPPTISEKPIVMHVGETVDLEYYRVTIISVKEASYVKEGDYYYKLKEGMKGLIMKLNVLNVGGSIVSCPLWKFVLLTDKGWAYDETSPYSQENIWPEDVTDEIRNNAVEYNWFPSGRSLAPNTYCEGDIFFVYPSDENPVKIVFKPFLYYTVEIVLSST